MKKILLIVFVTILAKFGYAQYPVQQYLGSDSSLVNPRGALKSRLVIYGFTDTTQANTQRINQYAGALIYTTGTDKVWYRNSTATGWIEFTSSGGSSVNIYNSDGFITGTRVLDLSASPLTFSRSGVKQFAAEDNLTTIGSPNNEKRITVYNDSITILGLSQTTDTTTYKPLAIDGNGYFTIMDRWPGGGGSAGWALTGNAGTDTATNFLGTTDNKPLIFKTNNTEYLRLNEFGRVGVNANSSIIGKLHIRTDDIRATQTDSTGLFLENSTVSTASVKLQSSPAIVFKGNGWNNSGLLNQPYLWAMDALPFSPIIVGTPTSSFRIRQNKNNEGYGTVFNIEGSGAFSFNSVSGGSTTTWGGTLNGASLKNLGETFIAGSSSSLLGSIKNTAVGSYTLFYSNGTGQANTAVGSAALYSDTSGSFNTAVGAGALFSNKNGSQNTAVGANSLFNNITGIKNTSVGAGTLENNTTGDDNTGIGQDALLANTTGIRNIGIGWNGFANNFTGGQNVGIGYGAGKTITNGNNNTILGAFAAWDAAQNDTITGAVIIGHAATASEDSTVVLGDDYIKKTHLKGVVYAPFTTGDATTSDSALVVDRSTGALIMRPVSGSSSYTFTNGLTESGGTVKLGGNMTNSTNLNGKGLYSLTLDSLTTYTIKSPGLTKLLTTSTQAYMYGNTSSTYMGVGTELFLAQQKAGNSISMSSDSFVVKMGGNNQLIIRSDSLTFTPLLGRMSIDTLAAASNMTNKKVMTWDTVTKRWEQIAKDSVGGSGGGSPAGNYGNVQLNRNGAFATPASDSLDFDGGLNIKGHIGVSATSTTGIKFGGTTRIYDDGSRMRISPSGGEVQWYTSGVGNNVQVFNSGGSNSIVVNGQTGQIYRSTDPLQIQTSGNVGIGNGVGVSATARLHISAGTATANTAPFKLTSGTNLTTPEAGAMEYNGTNLFFTPSSAARNNILMTSSVNSVSPTSPNRTITVVIDGTTYYIHAKTTND